MHRKCDAKARAIFAAVASARLLNRSRTDLPFFDAPNASYRDFGRLPG